MNSKKLALLFSIITGLFLLANLPNQIQGQSADTDPGHKEDVLLGDVRFSCPKGFDLQRSQMTKETAYLRHNEVRLGIVVSIPSKSVDFEYVTQLGELYSPFLPQDNHPYKWKRLNFYTKVSEFEVGGGQVQGFNGTHRILVNYRELLIREKKIVVAYVTNLGGGEDSEYLFQQNLGGMSMPGLYAQIHIIASITKEKYSKLNEAVGSPPKIKLVSPPIKQ